MERLNPESVSFRKENHNPVYKSAGAGIGRRKEPRGLAVDAGGILVRQDERDEINETAPCTALVGWTDPRGKQ